MISILRELAFIAANVSLLPFLNKLSKMIKNGKMTPYTGVGKYCDFRRLSQKRYEIVTWLLWIIGIHPWVLSYHANFGHSRPNHTISILRELAFIKSN